VSKADELNGLQYGEIEFQYEASRYTRLPELTSAGIQWSEWSEWTDFLKPLDSKQEAESAPLVVMMYRTILAGDSRDRRIQFRKYKGKFQLEWEFDDGSSHSTQMPAADVSRFFSTADAEAAKLRIVEAEAVQARWVQEEAESVKAKMKRPVNPDDYYPPGSIRREEQGSPAVQACVGPTGKLLREPVVTESSGFPELDGAAIKVARDTRYAAGTDERGTALPESCLKFKVKFTLKIN